MQTNTIEQNNIDRLNLLKSGNLNAIATETAHSKPVLTRRLSTVIIQWLASTSNQSLLPYHVVPASGVEQPVKRTSMSNLFLHMLNKSRHFAATQDRTFSDDESDNQSIREDDNEDNAHNQIVLPDEENQLVVTSSEAIINEPVDVLELVIAASDEKVRRLPDNLLEQIVARSAVIPTSNQHASSLLTTDLSHDLHVNDNLASNTLSTRLTNPATEIAIAPVIEAPVAGAPENPFAQSAAQFKALRDQLDALLIAEDFRSHAPQSAVHALNYLKADWTQQALQFERITQTRTIQKDVDRLKNDSLQSLMHVRRALAEQGNLWHRWVRPLLNALISWIAYVESCLGVPNRFQPRLFKATYAEEAFQTLQPDDNLREVHAAYARGMSAVAMAEV